MAVYFVTGKLGAGKTLAAVGRIFTYLKQGRIVATNLDLDLSEPLSHYKKDVTVYRIPDKPSVEHLNAIGNANKTFDEDKNGLLVLDECGTWFNTRNWSDKSRKAVIDWFLHARKLGWDIIFIVQDISLVDKQAREALAEHVGYCRRLDRISIPILSMLVKMITGKPLRFPRIHFSNIRYGDSLTSLIVDRWVYRGSEFYKAYDTKQCFTDTDDGVYSLLSPWHTHGRYKERKTLLKIAFHYITRTTAKLIVMIVRLFSKLTGRSPASLVRTLQIYKFLKVRAADLDKPTHRNVIDYF